MGDLILALKIIPAQPQPSTSSVNDPLDNSVLGNNTSEENKENNPLVTTASQLSSNQTQNSEIVTSNELHSDASNTNSHETENIADNTAGPADQNHCVKSDLGSTPMEGVEEGTCNGTEIGSIDNAKNDIPNENNIANANRMSTNSQVDMNMSDTEFSEKD